MGKRKTNVAESTMPTKNQQRVINAMATGRKLWLRTPKGSGVLTGKGILPAAVSANDMTELLYHVVAIERDHDDPLINGDYRLTARGQTLSATRTRKD